MKRIFLCVGFMVALLTFFGARTVAQQPPTEDKPLATLKAPEKGRSEISNAILGRGIVEEDLAGGPVTEARAGAIV